MRLSTGRAHPTQDPIENRETLARGPTGTYEWQSDFARKYVGQGRAEGREEGLEEGQLLARHDVLLRLLERRGVPVSEDERSRINACDDLDQLDSWFDRAITATTAEELFD